jgi:hypothetical protein
VGALYKELLQSKELSKDRITALKANNLYYLFGKIFDSDPYEANLFKAIFEYKVFSKQILLNP